MTLGRKIKCKPVGIKNRATITNSMRLLKLDGQIQEMLIQNLISSGHARALLSLEDKRTSAEAQKMILDRVAQMAEKQSALQKRLAKKRRTGREGIDIRMKPWLIYQSLEERMKSVMGTKVQYPATRIK